MFLTEIIDKKEQNEKTRKWLVIKVQQGLRLRETTELCLAKMATSVAILLDGRGGSTDVAAQAPERAPAPATAPATATALMASLPPHLGRTSREGPEAVGKPTNPGLRVQKSASSSLLTDKFYLWGGGSEVWVDRSILWGKEWGFWGFF